MSFFENSEIEKWQAQSLHKQRYAFREARIAAKLTPLDRDKVRPRNAHKLLAVNHFSRLLLGKLVCETISECFCDGGDGRQHNGEMFFATLAHVDGARSRDHRLSELELRAIKSQLRIGLQGSSFLGMLEPAYYLNLQSGVNFRERRCVFWHLHALVWGVKGRDLRGRLKKLVADGAYVAIADGKSPAMVQNISQGDLPSCVAYLVKYPDRGYRVWKKDVRDRDGNAVIGDHGVVLQRFKHKADQLRPGERLDLFHAMKHLSLDQLAMAGGRGTTLLKKIKKRVDQSAQDWGAG